MESSSELTSANAAEWRGLAGSDRVRAALDAVVQALRSPVVSLERLRAGVVRYGALAREQAVQLEDMLGALTRSLRDVIDALPAPRRDEVLAFVQWWAMHGYERAD